MLSHVAALPHVTAIRYVTPLREGGSLPALMEADDLGTYVVKFRGAGQGAKALVAEVVAGLLARALGLPVPDLATVEVDGALAAAEPDQEVQELLRASAGLNLAMDFLPGALDFDAGAFPPSRQLAGRVLWFDALVGNVDRSWRNPNMLHWHGGLYLIDHGATLTFHHSWSADRPPTTASAERGYDASEHALIGCDPDLERADAELAPLVTAELLREVVARIPPDWLAQAPGIPAEQAREGYTRWLLARLDARGSWLPGLRAAASAQAGATGGATPARPTANRPAWLTGGADQGRRR